MKVIHQSWLVFALSLSAFAQQMGEFELPQPIWSTDTGDIGPAGLPVRPSQAFTANGRDVIFTAIELGPQTTGVYASGRRILGSGEAISGVPNRTVGSVPFICVSAGVAPWMGVEVRDLVGIRGDVVMQGGRALFYPGQDPSVVGLPSLGSIFSSGFLPGATSELAYCGITVLLPNGSVEGSIHRVTTDGIGNILGTQMVFERGQDHPAFPVPITSFTEGAMSPSGKLIIGAFARDLQTNVLHGSLLLDGVPVLNRGDFLPDAVFSIGGFRSPAVNDRGDWAVAAISGPSGSEDLLIKNGEVLYSESAGSPLFGAPGLDSIRILGLTDDGSLYWMISGPGNLVPSVAFGELFRAIFRDDELIATNAGSYLGGERLLSLSYGNCRLDPAGHFLSLTTRVLTAAGLRRERVVIVPTDASVSYCDNGATSAGLIPRLGIYGSSELEHDTGFQALGRHLPPGAAVLMLASTDATSGAILGGSQGELCLGGGIVRSRLLVASRLGDVALDIEGFTPRPGAAPLMPGDVLHFQAWYRDQDPSGGSLTRLTEAVRVQFD